MHHIPNIISVLRILLVLPIAVQLHKESWMTALVLIFIAGLSDALDGFLAHTFNWQSRIGSFLDPIADKLLILIIFITLAYKEIIPVWLTCLVVARDIMIVAGATFYQWKTRDLQMSPLISSKINTALQILLVLGLLVHLAIFPLPSNLILLMQIAVALMTVISGVLYVVCWSRHCKNHPSQAANE